LSCLTPNYTPAAINAFKKIFDEITSFNAPKEFLVGRFPGYQTKAGIIAGRIISLVLPARGVNCLTYRELQTKLKQVLIVVN
jgi:hypothetical protein